MDLFDRARRHACELFTCTRGGVPISGSPTQSVNCLDAPKRVLVRIESRLEAHTGRAGKSMRGGVHACPCMRARRCVLAKARAQWNGDTNDGRNKNATCRDAMFKLSPKVSATQFYNRCSFLSTGATRHWAALQKVAAAAVTIVITTATTTLTHKRRWGIREGDHDGKRRRLCERRRPWQRQS